MNYYERHLGDYARDTAHLSLLEHGVYTILLDRFYATELPIPADQAHRIARARTRDERAAVDSVLAEFFCLEGDGYVQKRAQAEIGKAQARINAARENGKTGGRPRRNPEGTHRKPTGLISGTQIKALQTPSTNSEAKASGAEPPQGAFGQEPPDPKAVLWNLGVALLGDSSRSLIGKACKAVGETRVATILGEMAADPKADPKAYFAAATTVRERGAVC